MAFSDWMKVARGPRYPAGYGKEKKPSPDSVILGSEEWKGANGE